MPTRLADLPYPVASFFQPARNFDTLKALGINVVCGAEVENASNLKPADLAAAQAAWIRAAADKGLAVILKNPPTPVPPNCVGFMLSVDEPNRLKIRATAGSPMAQEFVRLRLLDPTIPIFLSLAGGELTSNNFNRPEELGWYKDYAAVCDIFTTNRYWSNLNASRYAPTACADGVAKLRQYFPDKPVWAWIGPNDQQLDTPTSTQNGVLDINREPTAAEIDLEVTAAIKAGAGGIGWFTTCQKAKYGWGTGVPNFATRGDSYWPLVNRKGESIKAQLDMVGTISKRLAPPKPDPVPAPPPPVVTPPPPPADVPTRTEVKAMVSDGIQAAMTAWAAHFAETQLAPLQDADTTNAKGLAALRETVDANADVTDKTERRLAQGLVDLGNVVIGRFRSIADAARPNDPTPAPVPSPSPSPSTPIVYNAGPDPAYYADPRGVKPYNYGHPSVYRSWVDTTDVAAKVTKAQVQAWAIACRDGNPAFVPLTIDGQPGRGPVFVAGGAPTTLDYEDVFRVIGVTPDTVAMVHRHLDWFFEAYPGADLALPGVPLFVAGDQAKTQLLQGLHARCRSIVTAAYEYRASDFARQEAEVRKIDATARGLYPGKPVQCWVMPVLMDQDTTRKNLPMPPELGKQVWALASSMAVGAGDSIVLFYGTWAEKVGAYGGAW